MAEPDLTSNMTLDIDWVRSQFPALALPEMAGHSFFENAGGSLSCRHTIDAISDYYLNTKVQPYAQYAASAKAGEQMDRSRAQWAEALGVETNDVSFGPSTSMNTYVLAQAFGEILGPGDEIIVTNQDHEANTGAVRRMAERIGATLREWRIDPITGLLDLNDFHGLLSDRTRLVHVPHCSNVVGQANDVAAITTAAHGVGARVIVDAVSYAPHGLADVAALGCDVYLFSLYKVYSVHQGLMVTRNGILDELPNQGHGFNSGYPGKRLTPAGPDHAQEAAAGAVLDYVADTWAHHGGTGDLRAAAAGVTSLWQAHEDELLAPVLSVLSESESVRLLGPSSVDALPEHRCPTLAFVPRAAEPEHVAQQLVDRGVQAGWGDFYAGRVLNGLDANPERGVVRLSFVHYTNAEDIDRLLGALAEVV